MARKSKIIIDYKINYYIFVKLIWGKRDSNPQGALGSRVYSSLTDQSVVSSFYK